MRSKFELSWTTCLLLVLIGFVSVRSYNSIKALEARVATLEQKANSTVEIHVERAYDRDMAAYGYKMIAVLPEPGKEAN